MKKHEGQVPLNGSYRSWKARRIWVTLLKFGVSALIIFYVVWSGRVGFAEIPEAFRNDPRSILIGFALLALVPLAGWLRWLVVVRAQGIPLGAYEALRIQLIGVFFNAFLLGSLGGDVLRAYCVATGAGSQKKAAAVTTVLLDRLLGALGFIPVLGISLALAWRSLPRTPEVDYALLIVAAIIASWMIALVLLLVPHFRERRKRRWERLARQATLRGRIGAALNDADEAVQVLKRHPRASLLCIAMSSAGHLATASAVYFFSLSLGMPGVTYWVVIVLALIVLLSSVVPLPGGGLGLAELLGSVVFGSAAAVGAGMGGTVVFMWRIGRFVLGPVGLVFFLLYREDVRRAREAHDEALRVDEVTGEPGRPAGEGGGGNSEAAAPER